MKDVGTGHGASDRVNRRPRVFSFSANILTHRRELLDIYRLYHSIMDILSLYIHRLLVFSLDILTNGGILSS